MALRGRTCVGCRRLRPKAALLRLVRRADGAAAVDVSGVAPGRGAYVCRDLVCLERARPKVARALRGARVDAAELERDAAEALRGAL